MLPMTVEDRVKLAQKIIVRFWTMGVAAGMPIPSNEAVLVALTAPEDSLVFVKLVEDMNAVGVQGDVAQIICDKLLEVVKTEGSSGVAVTVRMMDFLYSKRDKMPWINSWENFHPLRNKLAAVAKILVTGQ